MKVDHWVSLILFDNISFFLDPFLHLLLHKVFQQTNINRLYFGPIVFIIVIIIFGVVRSVEGGQMGKLVE